MPSAIPQNASIAKPWNSSLYDPLVLYAETTLPTGASASPNTAALQNPHSLPMELLGVRFHIHTLNTDTDTIEAGTVISPGGVTGLGVGVKMDMGALQIVDAGVPVSLFSSARDDSEDDGYSVFSTSAQVANTTSNGLYLATSSPLASAYDYLWRLARPMYVPPGATVTPLFTHLTQTPWDVRIGVTYYCRTFRTSAKNPMYAYVPWVSKYLSKSFDVSDGENAADSDQSSELDIRNPFPDACVELARLTGRVNFYFNGVSTGVPNVNAERVADAQNMADQIYEYMRLRIRSSRGDELVRSPTLFGSLFSQVQKTWDFPFGWMMQPSEYYKIFLSRDAFTGPETSAYNGRVQVGIGAVGYRKINTSTLKGAA